MTMIEDFIDLYHPPLIQTRARLINRACRYICLLQKYPFGCESKKQEITEMPNCFGVSMTPRQLPVSTVKRPAQYEYLDHNSLDLYHDCLFTLCV